jgi:DNA-binding GntR family transcriptional regulator
MPIREALLQLGKEGLVTLEPHKGAIVTPITIEDIHEIYYLRSILEPIAVGRSIPKLTQEDKHELRQLADEMEQAASNQDVEQFVKKNVEFHQMLRKGCNWRRTEMFLEMLWNGFPPHTPSILPRQMEQSLKEHNEMLDLIEKGDSERLESVVRNHILRTAEALKNHFESLK